MMIRQHNTSETQRQITEALGRYSKKVVEHWLSPRSFLPLDRPDGYARVTGPCGDTMEIYIRVVDGDVTEASFTTDGCLTSIVSASMAVELATGKSIVDVRQISQDDILEALDGLPEEDQHCALLAANTLHGAVEDYVNAVSEAWSRKNPR
jgi:nitrogen fixation NifU-like protein